jgi:hypothetical protein
MSKISFGFRAPHNFRQPKSFPGGNRRTVPYKNRIIYAENYESKTVRGMRAVRIVSVRTVFLIVDKVFFAPGNALELATTTILSCERRTSLCLWAVVTHLAGLCVDGPTRDGDGCSLVHEARLCDDAQEGHGRHVESCESCSLFEGCRTSDITRVSYARITFPIKPPLSVRS